jgi:hypothetical protein
VGREPFFPIPFLFLFLFLFSALRIVYYRTLCSLLDAVCDETGTCCDPTLLGCDGLCDSGSVIDVCGICGGAGDSCDGCDGVPASGLVLDSCGVCDGDDTSCLDCRSKLLRARWFAADDVDTVVGEVLIMPIPVDDYDIVDWYDYGAGVANSKSFGVVAGAKNPTLVDALRIVAVRDNGGSSFLVVTLDAVSGATGGSASLEIASNMGGFPVGVVVRDDPVDDIFIFNSADVSGLFDFEWPAHETDGFVLGPCPTETALCVNLTLTTSQNINGLSIGSWNTVDELLEDAVPHHSLIDAGATIEVCTHCSADLDCAGIGGGDHFYDLCDVCRSPTDSLDIIDSTCFGKCGFDIKSTKKGVPDGRRVLTATVGRTSGGGNNQTDRRTNRRIDGQTNRRTGN